MIKNNYSIYSLTQENKKLFMLIKQVALFGAEPKSREKVMTESTAKLIDLHAKLFDTKLNPELRKQAEVDYTFLYNANIELLDYIGNLPDPHSKAIGEALDLMHSLIIE